MQRETVSLSFCKDDVDPLGNALATAVKGLKERADVKRIVKLMNALGGVQAKIDEDDERKALEGERKRLEERYDTLKREHEELKGKVREAYCKF